MRLTWIAERLESAQHCWLNAQSETEKSWWRGYEAAMRDAWEEESNR